MSRVAHDAPLQGTAIVVVNYGPPHLLLDNLTVVAQSLAPAEVVVVDNFSTGAARDAVRELCEVEGWRGVFPEQNTGFGTGCNLGADAAIAAGADTLLFLNPDASLDRKAAELLLAALDDDVLVAPTLLRPDGSVASAGVDLDLASGEMRRWTRRTDRRPDAVLPWVSGACFALTVSLWRRAGGFDDDYFLYWEDVDLCARVQAVGGRVVLVPKATATHAGGLTHTGAGARAKSPVYYYYNIRNRELFAAKWLSAHRRGRWRRTSAAAAYRVLLRGGRRQFRHPVAPLAAAWRGLRDGARIGSPPPFAPSVVAAPPEVRSGPEAGSP
jgi:N-acetylglucosaminyl-diphospho-decaprenol L-rhamnosyltransferase